jgi:hypothetical protein
LRLAIEKLVINKRQAQNNGEQVEEVVVSGGHDGDLEEHLQVEGDVAHRSDRQEEEEGHDALDEVRAEHPSVQQPLRHVVSVPRQRRRDALRLEVHVQRCQIPPRVAAAGHFDHAGGKHQAEEQPADRPEADRRRRTTQSLLHVGERSNENAQKADFQKENVPKNNLYSNIVCSLICSANF